MPATFCDQRVAERLERLELTDHPVSAAMLPLASRAPPEGVLDGADRELELERFDRRVQRVAHRHVHRARAIRIRTRPLASADRLVVDDLLVTQGEVVHRALAE